MKKSILLAALGILLTALSVEAKVLYVDRDSGNDSTTYANNGSSSPWATLGRAAWGSASRSAPNASQAAQAGDVVIVRAGTYTTTGTNQNFVVAYQPVNSGTSGNLITFEAEGTVILNYSSGAGPVIGTAGKNYIKWKGFTINEVNAPSVMDTGPVVVGTSVGTVLEDLVIRGNPNHRPNDNHTGIRIERSEQITVRNCLISDIDTTNDVANAAGIQVYNSHGLLIEHNEIFNTGSGVFFKDIDDIAITQRSTIRFNLLYRTRKGGLVAHRSPNPASAPLVFYQNIVRDSSEGVRLWPFSGSDPAFVWFVNNTINNCTIGVMLAEGSIEANANNRFWNNIVTNSDRVFEHQDTGGTPLNDLERFASEHNVYSGYATFARIAGTSRTFAGWKSTYGQDSASPLSIEVDGLLLFLNLLGLDFRLQIGSPARSGGVDMLDLDGDGSTTDSIARGAYITGNEVIGRGAGPSAPTPPSPTAPSNVRVIR